MCDWLSVPGTVVVRTLTACHWVRTVQHGKPLDNHPQARGWAPGGMWDKDPCLFHSKSLVLAQRPECMRPGGEPLFSSGAQYLPGLEMHLTSVGLTHWPYAKLASTCCQHHILRPENGPSSLLSPSSLSPVLLANTG